MSNLYIYLSNKSFIDNQYSLFFNYLSNNYYNNNFNMDSMNYEIYSRILNTLNDDIVVSKDITNHDFNIFLNKHIYNLLNNNINSYIDIRIQDKTFMRELFSNNKFQYYTNNSNEILRLLSDNNSNISETFNISKNYNMYKTKYLNVKKTEKQKKLTDKTISVLKDKIYEIFIVIDGLEKIMYSNYNNLIEFQNKSFNDILPIIKNMYGTNHLNHKHPNFIYHLYNNKTIDYYDIYHDILTYPDLKNKIVIMFIQYNYLKYNETMKELIDYNKYKTVMVKIFEKFIDIKEQDDDDEIINLNDEQKQLILNKCIKKLFISYNKKLIKNFSDKYPSDTTSFSYNNIYNDQLNIKIEPIPISFINNINIEQFKIDNLKTKPNNSSLTSNKDIINELLPPIESHNTYQNIHSSYNLQTNNLLTEAENRLKIIEENKEDVDYMNHTINFFKDNFEDDENLSKLKESISFLDFEYINHFNIKVLRLKNNKYSSKHNAKLVSNIINDIIDDDPSYNYDIDNDTYIIDDYHVLSPIYESNFSVIINNETYIFKTLLHYIYFNQYLELYRIYYKYSNHTELSIITDSVLAYNLIFKNSSLNIFEESKSIISNKTLFKNYSELQISYHDLLNSVKYFMFKININDKINNKSIPYFDFILSYTLDFNIIYSDKYDNYLGIGKYGNGDNMIGIFMNEYKHYIKNNKIFEYNYNDIFLIICNFNSNVLSWFNTKLDDLLNHIINCCLITNNYKVDCIFINSVITHFYPQFITNDNIYYLPTHKSFPPFIKDQLQNILNSQYMNSNDIYISDKVIDELWKLCFIFIHNIFEFQNSIIDNSDDFQTFINYYDKHNIEHLLYYTLSIHNHTVVNEAINEYINNKNTQLKNFMHSNEDYSKYSTNILFNTFVDDSNTYNNLILNSEKSLQFNIHNETKYINIIKSKINLLQ